MSKNYYNYILLDANFLYKLVESFDTPVLGIRSISMEDVVNFKKSIIYIGKGKKERKNTHLIDAKLLLEGKMNFN